MQELYELASLLPAFDFPPRFNIAPTQMSVVVRLNKEGARESAAMKWGLVPSWAKDPNGGAKMIVAKAETIAEKPAHRSAFLRRRCLVVADGFYEWQKIGPKEKQPFFITRAEEKPFAFAGISEWWRPRDGSDLIETFAIVTTAANAVCAKVHDRMPVMLAPESWPQWLSNSGDHKRLLQPFPAGQTEMWPVSKAVGNIKNDSPELVRRIEA